MSQILAPHSSENITRPAGLASKKSVIEGLCNKYGVDEETATRLMNYDRKVRGQLNRAFDAASISVTNQFETRDGIASGVVGIMANLASNLPFGSLVGGAAKFATKAAENHFNQQKAQCLIDMNPNCDHQERGAFIKDLSAQIIEQKLSAIKGMSDKQAQSSADETALILLTEMTSGRAGDISEPSTVEKLTQAVAAKSSETKKIVGPVTERLLGSQKNQGQQATVR